MNFRLYIWLNPEVVDTLTCQQSNNLIVDHFEESQKGDDSVDAVFNGGENIIKIKSGFKNEFLNDLVLLFLNREGIIDDGVDRMS